MYFHLLVVCPGTALLELCREKYMTSFNIFFFQVKSLKKHLIVLLYVWSCDQHENQCMMDVTILFKIMISHCMYFHSVGYGGAVVS